MVSGSGKYASIILERFTGDDLALIVNYAEALKREARIEALEAAAAKFSGESMVSSRVAAARVRAA
jgi:hypothetical protein